MRVPELKPIRYLSWALALVLCFYSCRERNKLNGHEVIALQPIGTYPSEHLVFLKKDVEAFFRKTVVVLPEREMPAAFINVEKGKRYGAGQIIKWLAAMKPDSALAIAGLTGEDIFATKRNADGKIKQPESTYRVWGIFGLGYCPGPSCVISEKRLKIADDQRFRHRLRTVTIHEIGHTLGLPHCPVKHCIMSDANERMATVDQSGTDYCADCNRKIGRPQSE